MLPSAKETTKEPFDFGWKTSVPAKLFTTVTLTAAAVICSRMLLEIGLNCSEAISSDYIFYPRIIERIVSNPFLNWRDFFYGTHILVLPLLLTSLNAVLFGWSMRLEILFGLVLFSLRLTFVWSLIARKSPAVLGLLLLLQFSIQNLSVFDYLMAAEGFTTLGFCFALWALLNLRDTNKQLAFSGVGAFVASISAGTLIPCWAVLVGAALSLRIPLRKIVQFWAPAIFLSGLPYSMFFVLKVQQDSMLSPSFKFSRILKLIGELYDFKIQRPDVQAAATCIGVVIAALMVSILITRFRSELRLKQSLKTRFVASMALMSYGILCGVLIGIARPQASLWYIAYTIFFWFGLLGLSALLADLISLHIPIVAKRVLTACGCVAVICTTVVQLKLDPLAYDCWALGRSTAAANVLRHFDTAPTYSYFILHSATIPGLPNLIDQLKIAARHNWGKFWWQSEVKLQDDFLFPLVRVRNAEESEFVHWVDSNRFDQSAAPTQPRDLTIKLPEGSALQWLPSLPSGVKSADFKAQIMSDPQGLVHLAVCKDGARLMDVAHRCDKNWKNISIPLQDLKTGQIKVEIKALAGNIYLTQARFDLHGTFKTLPTGEDFRPSNIDDSPWFPTFQNSDFTISGEEWAPENLKAKTNDERAQCPVFSTTGGAPALTLKPLIGLDPSKYSHFCFSAQVPSMVSPSFYCIHFVLNQSRIETMVIPLLADGEMHRYSSDLKLLEFRKGEKITGVKLLPLYTRAAAPGLELHTGLMRFVSAKSEF